MEEGGWNLCTIVFMLAVIVFKGYGSILQTNITFYLCWKGKLHTNETLNFVLIKLNSLISGHPVLQNPI